MKFKKGSPAAKAFMEKLRAARGKKKKVSGLDKVVRKGKKTTVKYSRLSGVNADNFERIDNDTNGNPRFVIHFTKVADTYEKALKIGKKVGGKKYHNKKYGGGIVFQSYNIDQKAEQLNKAISTGIGAIRKKAVKKKAAPGTHKDSKSHNVKISVVSGINSNQFIDRIKSNNKHIDQFKKSILYSQQQTKKPFIENWEKKEYIKVIKQYKDLIKEYKAHNTQLKKHI